MSVSPIPLRPAPRLYCDGVLSPGAVVELSERATRHVHALRLHVGDALVLFNGDGTESAAVLTGIAKRGAIAAVRERREVDRESPLIVHLLQGVCAGDRMDLVLQKATELGVASVQPLITSRSIVRLSSERQERRETHWQNVVIAACEQCGRNTVPPVAPSIGFVDYLAQPADEGTRLMLAPDGDRMLKELTPTGPISVLIGPEGGLSTDERDMAQTAGFVSVRFGPRILRTETAPLATLAAMQALWGDC